jgi:hypothetical protein
MNLMKYIICGTLLLTFHFATATTVEEAGGELGNDTVLTFNTNLNNPDRTSESYKKGGGSSITTKHHGFTGVDFDPRVSTFIGNDGGLGHRTCDDASPEQFVDHEIKLVKGDILRWVDVWGNDNNPDEDLTLVIYKQCMPYLSAGPLSNTEFLIVNEIPRDSGNFIYSEFLNKSFKGLSNNCKVMARIRFGDFDLVNGCQGASDLQLYKVRAEMSKGDLIFMDNFQEF